MTFFWKIDGLLALQATHRMRARSNSIALIRQIWTRLH
jgi:hypothetical protein